MLCSERKRDIPNELSYVPQTDVVQVGANNATNQLNEIFERYAQNDEEQEWIATHFKKQPGKQPKCKTCKNQIQVNQLHVVVEALYVPPEKNFATECKFRFCPEKSCLMKIPPRSNLQQCKKIKMADETFTDAEYAICVATGLI